MDRPVVAVFTLVLVCVSTWACFKGIAFVLMNGWRSMFGLVALRGRAVIEFDDHCDDAILLTHEATEDEEDDVYAVDFIAWGVQCADLEDLAARLDAP